MEKNAPDYTLEKKAPDNLFEKWEPEKMLQKRAPVYTLEKRAPDYTLETRAAFLRRLSPRYQSVCFKKAKSGRYIPRVCWKGNTHSKLYYLLI